MANKKSGAGEWGESLVGSTYNLKKSGPIAGKIVSVEKVVGGTWGDQTRVTIEKQSSGEHVAIYLPDTWADRLRWWVGSMFSFGSTGKKLATRYEVRPHHTAKRLKSPEPVAEIASSQGGKSKGARRPKGKARR